ncbi:hypothetical protein VNO77_22985 [Canavalia gladiata]|uniref:Uncharacterized protein n=1 Tax=Canavalia gladiata TaxID=3824 RepID=A0AAN9L451_CANGL
MHAWEHFGPEERKPLEASRRLFRFLITRPGFLVAGLGFSQAPWGYPQELEAEFHGGGSETGTLIIPSHRGKEGGEIHKKSAPQELQAMRRSGFSGGHLAVISIFF